MSDHENGGGAPEILEDRLLETVRGKPTSLLAIDLIREVTQREGVPEMDTREAFWRLVSDDKVNFTADKHVVLKTELRT